MFRTALVFSFISMSSLAASYTVAAIPPPSGFTAVSMSGINNSGQVAGYGTISGTTQAFVGSPSGSIAIPFSPGGFTGAAGVAINASGQVAGGAGVQAFIGSPSGSAAIPLLATNGTATGNAVNDSGQVAGSEPFPIPRAFIGTPSASTAIALPPGGGFMEGQAVNNLGEVAGFVFSGAAVIFQPFIGTPASSALLPLPAGWFGADGYALNDSHQVAGYGQNAAHITQAFMGTTAGTTAIPLPTGATTATVGLGSLNSSGTVVGASDAGGWIWDPANGTRPLSNLVPSGWNITNGVSISNNGLILAQASFGSGTSQYVELTPSTPPSTPAPPTLLLLLIGLAFCWVWRTRSRAAGSPDGLRP